MSQTLEQIAQTLRAAEQRVQLIYAFNGTGKTRLSRALKEIVAPEEEEEVDQEGFFPPPGPRHKILYYNAFTEDLFSWKNGEEPRLEIKPNSFTHWILADQGQDQNIIANFQRYTDDKLTPTFEHDPFIDDEGVGDVDPFTAVTFSMERGDEQGGEKIKISKGEESIFIWSVFYTLLELVVDALQQPEPEARDTNQFDELEYIFIDDPVTSLDENHLIELAVNLSELIKRAPPELKFILTTHSPLFYNVLHNALELKKGKKKDGCYLLEKKEDGTFNLDTKPGDANRSFSYHLYLRKVLEEAIAQDTVERYHFMLLRNLYEKTAAFLGYVQWGDLLDSAPGDKQEYLRRIVQFSSHSNLSGEQVRQPTPQEKQTVKLLFDNLINNYAYRRQEAQDG